jgi:hypothetical protein
MEESSAGQPRVLGPSRARQAEERAATVIGRRGLKTRATAATEGTRPATAAASRNADSLCTHQPPCRASLKRALEERSGAWRLVGAEAVGIAAGGGRLQVRVAAAAPTASGEEVEGLQFRVCRRWEVEGRPNHALELRLEGRGQRQGRERTEKGRRRDGEGGEKGEREGAEKGPGHAVPPAAGGS